MGDEPTVALLALRDFRVIGSEELDGEMVNVIETSNGTLSPHPESGAVNHASSLVFSFVPRCHGLLGSQK